MRNYAIAFAVPVFFFACSTSSNPGPGSGSGDSGTASNGSDGGSQASHDAAIDDDGFFTGFPDGGGPPPPPPPPPKDAGGGWAAWVGGHGAIGQTRDDYASWQTRNVGTTDLYSVACVGADIGWTAGAGGFVAHTEDGGMTWAAQDAHLGASLRTIRFGTTALGVVAGDGGALAVTSDGGASWRPVTTSTTASLRGAAVAADVGVMLVVGDGGIVLRSADAGGSWTRSAIPGGADLRGVATDRGAHLVLTVDRAGAVWSSVDTGRTFRREAIAGASLEAVALADSGTSALAVGARGTALARDAQGTWTALSTGTTADLHAALITDADARRYVGGDLGTLRMSVDVGASWSTVATSTSEAIYGLEDL